jgi:hypothetical protein
VPRVHADYTLIRGDALGRHKLMGTGDRALPLGFVFGAPSAREPEPCVGELIRSAYSAAEQEPDADLGKSLREGWRAADGSSGGAALGTSTARQPPAAGEPCEAACRRTEARQLLAPPRSAELGVGQVELEAPRSEGEMAGLVAAAGLGMGEAEFQQVFFEAARLEAATAVGSVAGGGARCSLAGFMEARQQLLRQQAGM